MKHRLLACLVPHGSGERFASAANAAGAGGGTIVAAQGTAPSAVLQLLGIGTSAKELFFTVASEDAEPRVRAVLEAAAADGKKTPGFVFRAGVSRFARFGIDAAPGAAESTQTDRDAAMDDRTELLAFVVNKGFADDAMAAARRAGAGGGTVIKARGTAKPDDETFFGVPLVPEKELLLVIAGAATAAAAFDAVAALPCFKERGSGIAFRVPVSDFAMLGAPGAAKDA